MFRPYTSITEEKGHEADTEAPVAPPPPNKKEPKLSKKIASTKKNLKLPKKSFKED